MDLTRILWLGSVVCVATAMRGERELNSGMCYVMHGDNIDVKCQYLKVMGKKIVVVQQKSMKRKSHTAVSSRPNGEDHGSTNFFESSVRLFPGKLATTIQFIN